MENILVAKKAIDVSTYANLKEALDAAAVGDIIGVGDGRVLLGTNTVTADLFGIRSVQFVVKLGITNFRTSVSIPRENIKTWNIQLHTSAVNAVYRLGGTTALTSLVIPSIGEGNLILKNLSYNHAIPTQRVSYSVTKKSTETVEAFIDRVVLELNELSALQIKPFYTAVKVGSAPNFGIDFTTSDTSVDLSISRDGIFMDAAFSQTVSANPPLGAGADVVRMEKDMSRHQGNHGYVENTDLWYKTPLVAKEDLIYEIGTLSWEGIAPARTALMPVASNTLSFAVSDEDDRDSVFDLVALVAGQVDESRVDDDPDATDPA